MSLLSASLLLLLLAVSSPGVCDMLHRTLEPVVWEDPAHQEVASRPAASCVHCALLCSRTRDCVTVSCPAGRCRLLTCAYGAQPAAGRCPRCEPGWSRYGSACYTTETTPSLTKTWADSQRHCGALRAGARLASVHTAAENHFIWTLFKDNGYSRAWIGLEHPAITDPALVLQVSISLGADTTTPNYQFRWVDGSLVSFTNWASDQPNNKVDLDLGVFVRYSTGKWVDFPKTNSENLTQICKYTLY
ncbi:C-type mannose receptor 2 [Amphibalanus amphitrite]|uniref:C-type mannose receptor 2 n=1 Tax=Amphibalanus amphitrite TaxID=1232801 RepID=A0A6A4V869_AMPAM|nr:C-type mannose receptor 2 [Amphibalanus amphitrite]